MYRKEKSYYHDHRLGQTMRDNPVLADLFEHRPTRLGEMYSQLFDNEWSDAFEVLKSTTKEDEDEIYPDTLSLLQKIVQVSVWYILHY
jgi:hypothetical protein